MRGPPGAPGEHGHKGFKGESGWPGEKTLRMHTQLGLIPAARERRFLRRHRQMQISSKRRVLTPTRNGRPPATAAKKRFAAAAFADRNA